MSTYRGVGSVERAQADLDRHVMSCADGVCVACGVPGPCEAHVPPELIGARRVGAVGLRRTS